jgi:hypothetical protein
MFNKTLAVAALALLSQAAYATAISNSTTGFASPIVTITFDEHVLPVQSAVTSQYADLGVTFSPNLYYSSQIDEFPNITGNNVSNFNFIGDGDVFQFSLNFATDQTDVAFAMVSNGTTWLFEALLNNSVIDAFTTFVEVSDSDFFGFTGITFDEIRITSLDDDYMIIDNLQLGNAENVPEPAALALLGMGMAGFAARRRVKLA